MVEKLIGYEFNNKGLLEKALTHPSAVKKGEPHYERLEFLGDAVLDIVISEYLFNRYKDEQEGALAKRRSALVRRETLGEISYKLGLGEYLRLGRGEEASGGRENRTNLANVFEAIIGAMYLDGGLDPSKEFLLPLFMPLAETMNEPPKDPKTSLQEWAQGNKKPLPIYKVVKEEGPSHSPQFTVEVEVEGEKAIIGKGSSKREAEQEAARAFLQGIKSA